VYIQLRTYRLIAQRDKLEALVRERTAQLKVEIEERQRVELEKTELKLDHLKRELLTQSLHLNDKQQIMDNLQSELESFSKLSWNDVKPRIKKLLHFLRDRSSVKQGWEDFEIWFTEIHTGFYSELRNSHPGLSENELKVCALLRLNLISKDIAKVMNVQPSSIDIYRHRIRKKLEIGSEENLSTFLSKY
jgi:DNA-binding CsgD family transcriptional regulator